MVGYIAGEGKARARGGLWSPQATAVGLIRAREVEARETGGGHINLSLNGSLTVMLYNCIVSYTVLDSPLARGEEGKIDG